MEKFVFEVEMDSKVKQQVDELYMKLGLPFEDAIRVFAHASLMVQGIPFPLISDKEKLRRYLVRFFIEEVGGWQKKISGIGELRVGNEWPDVD